ncbi:hypothetical protein NM96_04710 [Neisseria mucosa]|nr:hypothetical protein NM96_04710 [Neisseria mucosa]
MNKGRLKNGLAKSAVYGSETRCTRFQTTLWQNVRFILPLCCRPQSSVRLKPGCRCRRRWQA